MFNWDNFSLLVYFIKEICASLGSVLNLPGSPVLKLSKITSATFFVSTWQTLPLTFAVVFPLSSSTDLSVTKSATEYLPRSENILWIQ